MPFHDDGQLISTSSATVADPRTFYDELAGQYHLLFLDWWESARRQGEVIGSLLRRQGVAPPAAVLDCTCGIGTQALPLAATGYRVVGSDLSESAIARAGQAWRWAEDHRTVEINLFMLRQQETGWATTVHSGTYRALQRHELTAALTAAGFADVKWLAPDESGYYQPVVLARAG